MSWWKKKTNAKNSQATWKTQQHQLWSPHYLSLMQVRGYISVKNIVHHWGDYRIFLGTCEGGGDGYSLKQ